MKFLEKFKKTFRVSSAYIYRNRIYVVIDGYDLPSKRIKIVAHEPWVGSHEHGANKKIFLDDNIAEEELHKFFTSIHEAIESWLKVLLFKKLNQKEAYPMIHKISQYLEKRYVIKKFGKAVWYRYMAKVNIVWRKENNG